MSWYLAVLKKYAVFSGRALRKEYWMFFFVNLIIGVALALIEVLVRTTPGIYIVSVLSGLYSLAVLLPSLGVAIRRLHDTGHTGWWLLIGLIPIIGGIVLLVLYVEDSQPGDNRYGPNPKAAATLATEQASASRVQPTERSAAFLVSAFRSRSFNLYCGGALVAELGKGAMTLGLMWLAPTLMTGRTALATLGLVAGLQAISHIVFLPLGGLVADRVDRRRMVMVTSSLFFFLLLLLAMSTVTQTASRGSLLAFSILLGIVTGFDTPARLAVFPHLLRARGDLMNGIAWHRAIVYLAMPMGMALAGVFIASVGIAPVIFGAAACNLAMVAAMALARLGDRETWQSPQQERGFPIIASVTAIALIAAVFGFSLISVLMPAIMQRVNMSRSLLTAAMGWGLPVGAVLAVFLGWLMKKNVLLVGSSVLYGLLLVLLSLSGAPLVSAATIFLLGVMQAVFMVTSLFLIQNLVRDRVRGLVLGIFSIALGLQALGSLQAGVWADYLGAPAVLVIAGIEIALIGPLLLAAEPRLRRLNGDNLSGPSTLKPHGEPPLGESRPEAATAREPSVNPTQPAILDKSPMQSSTRPKAPATETWRCARCGRQADAPAGKSTRYKCKACGEFMSLVSTN